MSNETYADTAGPNMTNQAQPPPQPHPFFDPVVVLSVEECEWGEEQKWGTVAEQHCLKAATVTNVTHCN